VLLTGAQWIHVEEKERLEDWKERACFYPGVNRKRHRARCTHSCMRRGIGRRTGTRRKAHRSKCTLSPTVLPLLASWRRFIQVKVELYLHSPRCLHGIVLNWLSTGTTLPYLYTSRTVQCRSGRQDTEFLEVVRRGWGLETLRGTYTLY
jgi:hypothetical protein